jgi:two-component system cell cycle sensor histidine kinase/response regulator CckA
VFPLKQLDDEELQVYKAIRGIAWLNLIVVLTFIILDSLSDYTPFESSIPYIPIVVILPIIVLILLEAGEIKIGTYLLNCSYWVIITLFALNVGGFDNPLVLFLPVIVFSTAIFLGLRAGILMAVLNLMSLFFIYLNSHYDFINTEIVKVPGYIRFFSFGALIISIIVLVSSPLSDLEFSKKSIKLRENEISILYNNVPILLFELNLSRLNDFFEEMGYNTSNDLRVFLDKSPDNLNKCISMIYINRVNSEAFRTLKVNTTKQLYIELPKYFTQNSLGKLREFLLNIFDISYEKFFETTLEINSSITSFVGKWKILEPTIKKNTVLISLLDISALKAKDLALNEMNERLDQALKMESIGRLAGGVAHDFNNILTGMMGYLDLVLMEEKLSEDSLTMISEVKSLTNDASALTQELLSFSRERTHHPTIVDLNEIIKDNLKLINTLARDHVNINFNLDVSPLYVRVDPKRFEQLFVNLIVNSIDAIIHTGDIWIKTSEITEVNFECPDLETSKMNKYARLSITDTGLGIPEENLTKIYEPFFTTKEEGKGTGLGLSTVYGIVSQSGGCIHVSSVVNKGTTFHVLLPIQEVVQLSEESETYEPSYKIISEPVKDQNTILVVDDNNSILTILSKALLSKGFNVIATTDPLEGLHILRDQIDNIDLVVTDIVMPELSGVELIERFITNKPDIKVIFITAYIHDPNILSRVEHLDFPIMKKPFEFDKLIDLIIETLGIKK